jgi:hypothetical protein
MSRKIDQPTERNEKLSRSRKFVEAQSGQRNTDAEPGDDRWVRCGKCGSVLYLECKECACAESMNDAYLRNQERMQADDPETEKLRRVYYQDIVYEVCNLLDTVCPGTTVCGSWAEPSREVQERVSGLIKRLSDARDRIESLQAQLFAISMKEPKQESRCSKCGGTGVIHTHRFYKDCEACDGKGY